MSAQLAINCPRPATSIALPAGTAIGLAIVMLVGMVFADARVEGLAPSAPFAPQPVVGTFTGTYAEGLPVYRLPAIEITAPRSAD